MGEGAWSRRKRSWFSRFWRWSSHKWITRDQHHSIARSVSEGFWNRSLADGTALSLELNACLRTVEWVLQVPEPRKSLEFSSRESRVSQEEGEFTFSCLLLSIIFSETRWVLLPAWMTNLPTNPTGSRFYLLWKGPQKHTQKSFFYLSFVVLGVESTGLCMLTSTLPAGHIPSPGILSTGFQN